MPCYVSYRVSAWSDAGIKIKEDELSLFEEVAGKLNIDYKINKDSKLQLGKDTYTVFLKDLSQTSILQEEFKFKQIQKSARKKFNMVTKKVKQVKVGK